MGQLIVKPQMYSREEMGPIFCPIDRLQNLPESLVQEQMLSMLTLTRTDCLSLSKEFAIYLTPSM